MKYAIKLIIVTAIIAMIGYGINGHQAKTDTLQLKQIELEDRASEIERLRIKSQDINRQLNEAVSDDEKNAERIERLQQEKNQLEQERNSLQEQLQAKREAQRQERQSAIASTVSVSETGDFRTVMDFYIANGFTKVAAANLAGTIMQESGFQPNGACGDGGRACGIFQWHPDRRYGMPSTLSGQLQYSIQEMQQDSPNSYAVLTSSSDTWSVRSAIKSWIRWGHTGSRWIYADQYLAKY